MGCACHESGCRAGGGTAFYDATSLSRLVAKAETTYKLGDFKQKRVVVRNGRPLYLYSNDEGRDGEAITVLKGIPIRITFKVTDLNVALPAVEAKVELKVYLVGGTDPLFSVTFKLYCENVFLPETCRVNLYVDEEQRATESPVILGCDYECVARCAGGICLYCFDLPFGTVPCVAACAVYCYIECC